MSRRVGFVTLVVATLVAAGCAGGDDSGGDDTAGTTTRAGTDTVAAPAGSAITLRAGRTNTGPWRRSLSLEHGPDGVPTTFFVCAAWEAAGSPAACEAAPGAKLPAGTVLRLEQSPVGAAVATPESPDWATVGTSEDPELQVPLSDFVSGLDLQKATYRVTLRPRGGGQALATSNPVTVVWSQ